MGVISKDSRQIKLYYNSETSLGKQTLAYVEASDKKILTIDISKTKVTGTQWLEIADKLNVPISALVNQEHPDFVQNYGDKQVNLEQNDWLKLLEKHPIIIKCPIVINGNQFLQIKNPSDFAKYLDQE
jgi:arsenate reductase-like glutaredoxin family protein